MRINHCLAVCAISIKVDKHYNTQLNVYEMMSRYIVTMLPGCRDFEGSCMWAGDQIEKDCTVYQCDPTRDGLVIISEGTYIIIYCPHAIYKYENTHNLLRMCIILTNNASSLARMKGDHGNNLTLISNIQCQECEVDITQ